MNVNTGNVTPDQGAIVTAKGFQLAARHLDAQLATPGIESDPLAVWSYAVPSIVLRALATELALKALYMQETGKEQKHIHDLLCLFNKLPGPLRASVEQRFERIRGEKIASRNYSGETDPLPQVLTNHRNDFEVWRYLHEKLGTGASTRPLVLNSVIEAAVEEFVSRLPNTGVNQPPMA